MTPPIRRTLVTIVIPARNEATAIEQCLDAVLAQTYPASSTEVVIVSAGSTDDTVAVASKRLAAADVLRWEVMDEAAGTTPSNLNLGLAWASGSVLVRVDARSIIPVDYVARIIDCLANERYAVVGGSQVAIARSDHWRDRSIGRALNNRYGMGGSRYRRAGAASGPADTVYLGSFRTEQLRSVGGWNEAFTTNQDFELNRRMSALGEIHFENGLQVHYLPRRTHGEIARQYHRFGRWKASYWASTNDRPRPRQLLLLVLPPVAIAVGLAAVILAKYRLMTAVAGMIVGSLAVDAAGSERSNCDPAVRLVAGGTNLLIGAAWWSGVVRGSVRPESLQAREPAPQEMKSAA